MRSVMSLEMYKKLKLNNLNSTSIPHVVEASGESLVEIKIDTGNHPPIASKLYTLP